MSLHLWNLGYRKVVVESNCLEAVRITRGESHVLSDHALVFSIGQLLARGWNINVRHIGRMANSVADGLTRLYRGAHVGTVLFQEPPLVTTGKAARIPPTALPATGI
ncbi:hypothetical protein V6N11_041288 [Hibiscus sabdariffa]|uniref:RNase H type-1 domain-containing protein n=1 Tax=Hibiscus sabdariffa TaxID=183260 RepID=A0ABR2RK30_9ROSI